MTKHFSLGGSSASRFLACPGSPALIASLGDGTDTSDAKWRERGTAAHNLAGACLVSAEDAWENASGFPGLDGEDAVAVQQYLDFVRSRDVKHQIEEWIAHPDLHPQLGGTIDCWDYADGLLRVIDYKHGVGVVVPVENNAQLMYYAFLALMKLDTNECREVELVIAQPRVPNGIQTWNVSAADIFMWGFETLIPGMVNTQNPSAARETGKHCQFCPAKLICPEALAVYDGLTATPAVARISDEDLDQRYAAIPVAMFVKKAIEAEIQIRMMKGDKFASAKLVEQKADRVWKPGAEAIFQKFDGAYDPPKMKSPAQMEKVPLLKDKVAEWAHKPNTGYTIASIDDRRRAVSSPSAADTFQHYGEEK